MLSLRHRTLRIHRGYGFAPDHVLAAIIRFLTPRIPRALRRRAEEEFLAFPVGAYTPVPARSARQERARPGDSSLLRRLRALHQELNQRHFGGTLGPIRIRLSARMKTRLGELSVDLASNRPNEIGISRRHIARHSWAEVEHTILHEMVHQWQAETGHPVDHGSTFKAKAREVGVLPASSRRLATGTLGNLACS
jgi:hypothetical protein